MITTEANKEYLDYKEKVEDIKEEESSDLMSENLSSSDTQEVPQEYLSPKVKQVAIEVCSSNSSLEKKVMKKPSFSNKVEEAKAQVSRRRTMFQKNNALVERKLTKKSTILRKGSYLSIGKEHPTYLQSSARVLLSPNESLEKSISVKPMPVSQRHLIKQTPDPKSSNQQSQNSLVVIKGITMPEENIKQPTSDDSFELEPVMKPAGMSKKKVY